MFGALQVIAITVILAVILDLFIISRVQRSRSMIKELDQSGKPVTIAQVAESWYKSARAFGIEFWRTMWQNEHRSVQVIVAGAALAASIAIGVIYSSEDFITVYPIILWVIEIFICIAMLYPSQAKANFQVRGLWPGLLALLVFAFLLRFVGLSGFPAGFHTDEYGTADFVQRHVLNPLNGGRTLNPFILDSNFQPALYDYLWRLTIHLFGFSLPGARMSSVIAGTLSIGAIFAMTRELATPRIAWLTAILAAVYHYHIHWSRLALNNIWATVLLPLTIYFFVRGWRKGWPGGAVWAGLCLGLSAYFYAGGYIVILLLPILAWQEWNKTSERVPLAAYCGKTVAIAATVAAPIIVFAFRYPGEFFQHAGSIYAWNPEFNQATSSQFASPTEFFLHQLGYSFGAYNFFFDVTGFYAPGIPFLIGVASAIFLWGVGWAIYKKQYFPVVWILLVTILGGMLINGTPSSSHYIVAIPAICWLTAIPLDWLIENKRSRWAYLFLTVIIATDLFFYFVTYRSSPSTHLILDFPMVQPYSP